MTIRTARVSLMNQAARALPHHTIIQDSWTRRRDFGLTHRTTPRVGRPAQGEVSALLDSQHSLVQTTHQEVLPYYGNILANSNCLIMLADHQGQVLQSWGGRRFVEPHQAAGFVAGA